MMLTTTKKFPVVMLLVYAAVVILAGKLLHGQGATLEQQQDFCKSRDGKWVNGTCEFPPFPKVSQGEDKIIPRLYCEQNPREFLPCDDPGNPGEIRFALWMYFSDKWQPLNVSAFVRDDHEPHGVGGDPVYEAKQELLKEFADVPAIIGQDWQVMLGGMNKFDPHEEWKVVEHIGYMRWWTCADKSRILEHDENDPPKFWCRKPQTESK